MFKKLLVFLVIICLSVPAFATTNNNSANVSIASSKSVAFNNSLTLAGTDGATMTFPSTSDTVGGLGTSQTWTGLNNFTTNNVGIGSASPGQALDVNGTVRAIGSNLSGLTASQIVATDASKNLQTLTTATYPSLTELSYVKGVTSAIQTQINSKTSSQWATQNTTDVSLAGGNVGIGTTKTTTAALTVMNGNVGIGTWAPTYPLQVLGNFQAYQPVVTVTAGATPTIVAANGVDYEITGLSTAITSMSTNLSGTTTNGAIIEIDITDNATPQGLTFGTSFESTTVTLPTTTVASTRLRLFFQYNSTSGKWSLIGMA